MKKIITEPLVTIVVRTCNRPFLLKRALNSILNQNYPALEIVVVDDGAYKINPSFLKMENRHCRIKYVKTGQKGRSFAANKGMDTAGGEFIIFLDDDDELYPDHVRVMVNSLFEEKTKEKTVVYSDCEFSFETYDNQSDKLTIDRQFVRFSTDFNQGLLFARNYIPLMCLCFPASILKEAGGFDEAIDLYEDWDLLLRLSFKIKFHHVQTVTAKYRFWSKDQITAASNPDTRKDYYNIASRYIKKLTIQNLYEIFLYSEEAYNKIAQLSECQSLLSEKDSDLLELSNINAQQKEKIDLLEQELAAAENKLAAANSAANNELSATENKLSRATAHARTLLIEKDELAAIHKLYMAENIRKEEHIAMLEHDIAKKISNAADTRKIQDTP